VAGSKVSVRRCRGRFSIRITKAEKKVSEQSHELRRDSSHHNGFESSQAVAARHQKSGEDERGDRKWYRNRFNLDMAASRCEEKKQPEDDGTFVTVCQVNPKHRRDLIRRYVLSGIQRGGIQETGNKEKKKRGNAMVSQVGSGRRRL